MGVITFSRKSITTIVLSILLHGVISLPDATSYDKVDSSYLFSDVAIPLIKLSKKGRPNNVAWQHAHSFKTRKGMLIRSSILLLLVFNKPFVFTG